MTVQSVKKSAVRDSITVGFADGSFFTFADRYLPPDFQGITLAPGDQCGDEVVAAIREASQTYDVELVALRLVSRSEQSSGGLLKKLLVRGASRSAASAVLSALLDSGLVDDERFAELWLGMRLRLGSRSEGRNRLLGSLMERGVPRSVAERALISVYPEEAEGVALERWWRKKGFLTEDAVSIASAKRAALAAGFSVGALRALRRRKDSLS